MVAPDFPQVLFEDQTIMVVAKPAGLPTANAARAAPSLFTAVRARLGAGAFLGVVSRLDAPVSGAVVLAKTRAAAADLARQFRERLVEKHYVALVEGRFPGAVGVWVDWHDVIARTGDERRSRVVSAAAEPDQEPGVERAACHVTARVVRRGGEVSLVELRPSSGRRHQLRVQLASRGCPIVGDRTYGARLPFPSVPGSGPAIALHAGRLAFVHPATRRQVEFHADWPSSWRTRYPGLCGDPNATPPRGPARFQ